MLLAAVILFALPDAPHSVRWLAPEEKTAIETALAKDDDDVGEHSSHAMFAALRMPRVLLIGVIGLLVIGSFITLYLSAPMVLAQRTGLARTHVGYLVSGGGALGMVGMLIGGAYGDKTGDRFKPFYVSTIVFGAASFVIGLNPSPLGVAIAYLVGMMFWSTVTLSCVTVTTAVVQRRHVAVAMAAMNTLSQIGAFLMPYGWGALKDATGTFTYGLYALVGFLTIAVALIAVLQRHLQSAGGKNEIGRPYPVVTD